MQTENYRKNIIISLSAALFFLLTEVILFWNASVYNTTFFQILPFLSFILVILAMGFAINNVLKVTNQKAIKELIDKEVTEERLKILKEFEKKDEAEQLSNEKEQIENLVKEVVPKGNFKNVDSLLGKFFKNVCGSLGIVQGVLYNIDEKKEEYIFSTGYALTNENKIPGFKKGETLPGQVVEFPEIAYISEIPEEYFSVESGLGKAKPKHLAFVPVLNNNQVVAILELASFKEFNDQSKEILEKSSKEVSSKIAQTIKS